MMKNFMSAGSAAALLLVGLCLFWPLLLISPEGGTTAVLGAAALPVAAPFARWFCTPADHQECRRLLRVGGPAGFLAVYLSVPASALCAWLLDLLPSAVRLVGVEKPWFGRNGLRDARRVVPQLERAPFVVRCLDHFETKPGFRFLLQQGLGFYLGGPARRVVGRLLEPAGQVSLAAGRTGANLDLLVHLVTTVRALFPGCPIVVQDVAVGRHINWRSAAEHGNRRFRRECYVRMTGFIDTPAGFVELDLAAGKFCPATLKYLAVEAADGSAVRVNFVNDMVWLVRPALARLLFPYPGADVEPAHHHLVRRLTAGDTFVGMDLDAAVAVLEVLDAVQRSAPQPVPTYSSYPAWMPRD